MTVTALLIDDETGETLAETELEAEDLPPSFAAAEVVLDVRDEPWRVVRAEPDGRAAIAAAGSLKLRLRRAKAGLVHEDPTRDDDLPELEEARRDDGLALPPGDYRQVELVSAALRSAIDAELEAIRPIVESGRPGAFPRCHVRKGVRAPFAGQTLTRAEVVRALGGQDPRALSLRGRPGVVRGGFAIPLGDVIVYGVVRGEEGEKGGTVRVLGIAGRTADAAGDLAPLAAKLGLLLVDWRACRVFEATEEGFADA
jgi:hypothetical protein